MSRVPAHPAGRPSPTDRKAASAERNEALTRGLLLCILNRSHDSGRESESDSQLMNQEMQSPPQRDQPRSTIVRHRSGFAAAGGITVFRTRSGNGSAMERPG